MPPLRAECPSCQATLKIGNPALAGKTVKCPKCAKPVVVPALEDDEELAESGSADRAKADDERPRKPSRPAPRDDDEEEEEPARKPPKSRNRRADEDDDREDDLPRRKKKGPRRKPAKSKAPLLIGGAVLLVLIGVGLFFGLRGKSGGSGGGGGGGNDSSSNSGGSGGTGVDVTAMGAPPKRELPKDLFVYWPNEEYQLVNFRDYAYGRQNGETAKPFITVQLKTCGIRDDQINQHLELSNMEFFGKRKTVRINVFALNEALDLAQAVAKAERTKFETIKRDGATLYRTVRSGKNDFFMSWQAFQPNPTLLVLVSADLNQTLPDTKLAEELMGRGPGNNKLPEGLWATMQEVSGYSNMSALIGSSDGTGMRSQFMAYGYGGTPTHAEKFGCFTFANENEAKRGQASAEQLQKNLKDMIAKARKTKDDPASEKDIQRWVKGSRLYMLERTPRK